MYSSQHLIFEDRYRAMADESVENTRTEVAFPPRWMLTVDVEDWYRLIGQYFGGGDTPRLEALSRQLGVLLEIMDRHQCRGTFFCLGGSLHDAPQLVKLIADAGHEIATHGWGHEQICNTGLDHFAQDLRRSVHWLEDLLGRPVLGYRAPQFSVAPHQLEKFLDICFDVGLVYDSSVFPIGSWRYGIPNGSAKPTIVRVDGTRHLVELPVTTTVWMGKRWPVGGGGWWRVLPEFLINSALERSVGDGTPVVTYLHPHELDPQHLNATWSASRSLRLGWCSFRENLGRNSMSKKLDRLLSKHRFIAVEDYLRELDLL